MWLILILCPLLLKIVSSPLSDKFKYELLDFYQFRSNQEQFFGLNTLSLPPFHSI